MFHDTANLGKRLKKEVYNENDKITDIDLKIYDNKDDFSHQYDNVKKEAKINMLTRFGLNKN